jgi:hypothetical protein
MSMHIGTVFATIMAATFAASSGCTVFLFGMFFGNYYTIFQARTLMRVIAMSAVAVTAGVSTGVIFYGASSGRALYEFVGLFCWCMVVCFLCGNLATVVMDRITKGMDPEFIKMALAEKNQLHMIKYGERGVV